VDRNRLSGSRCTGCCQVAASPRCVALNRYGQLVGEIPRHPPVQRRPVHSCPGGYLHHLSAIQDRADRVQALFDNRQDNQCQSRPPQSDAPRKRRTRVAENKPLSQITWRRNVARQSPEDNLWLPVSSPTCGSLWLPEPVRNICTALKARGARRAPSGARSTRSAC